MHDETLPWYAELVVTAIMILACLGTANVVMFLVDWVGKMRYCADCKKKRFSSDV